MERYILREVQRLWVKCCQKKEKKIAIKTNKILMLKYFLLSMQATANFLYADSVLLFLKYLK